MMKALLRFIMISGMVLILLLGLAGLQFYYFTRSSMSVGNGYVLVILPGTSVQKIAEQLSKDGVIRSTWNFLFWVKWQQAWTELKAGEYLIKPGTTPTELIQQLRDGKVIQHALTIVPGWNFQRLMEVVNQEPKLSHTLQGLKPEDIMVKLGHAGEHPEGRFFADTYYFPAGTSDVAFLKRAYNILQEKLNTVWNQRAQDLPIKSAYEALILASIIEKESSFVEEYNEISGVYSRRLLKSMPLQADPTVIYGAGKEVGAPITKEMLKTETPYNTYQIAGLPPTPIAFPSLKALEAAVHPKEGETLYFVANVDGKGHVFSKTLEEHQVAVTRYRKATTPCAACTAPSIPTEAKTETTTSTPQPSTTSAGSH
jgi:UPF0755 protein